MNDFPGLLRALRETEIAFANRITVELAGYELDKPISTQNDRSGIITDYAEVLFCAYEAVATVTGAVPDPSGDLAAVVGTLSVAKPLARTPKTCDREVDFLNGVGNLLVLSLWVSSLSDPGRRLLTRLATTKKPLSIGTVYKSEPSSLLANPNAHGVNATAAADAGQMTEEEDETQTRSRLARIAPGHGGESVLSAPVHAPELEEQWKIFETLSARDALIVIMRGSISFDAEGRPYYSPSRVELMHELLHIHHNALGENRANLPMNQKMRAVWKDAEEFWTIAAGDLTESDFAVDLGLPRRRSHSGLRLSGLDPRSADAQKSFRQHFEYLPD
ncbi:hypothetical protein DMA12_21625 [Amycolatopsis balhimycina DSM 5908]|uniref:Uncharacterized protein n=1 Tax=Amycolatopsis balhimycina DSM 5908 TaxID=1081091 RepID=A0A428WHE6_AMYBA|nr:hypothetical protein DMA12_21625 [Amycolatopsis balhimycina DSM 5908]